MRLKLLKIPKGCNNFNISDSTKIYSSLSELLAPNFPPSYCIRFVNPLSIDYLYYIPCDSFSECFEVIGETDDDYIKSLEEKEKINNVAYKISIIEILNIADMVSIFIDANNNPCGCFIHNMNYSWTDSNFFQNSGLAQFVLDWLRDSESNKKYIEVYLTDNKSVEKITAYNVSSEPIETIFNKQNVYRAEWIVSFINRIKAS